MVKTLYDEYNGAGEKMLTAGRDATRHFENMVAGSTTDVKRELVWLKNNLTVIYNDCYRFRYYMEETGKKKANWLMKRRLNSKITAIINNTKRAQIYLEPSNFKKHPASLKEIRWVRNDMVVILRNAILLQGLIKNS